MDSTNTTPTFQTFWQLLQPSVVFGTRGRFEKCLSIWTAMDEPKRLRIYRLVESKKLQGQFVHPNPCFALDDALQEDEIQQSKSQEKTTPQFLSGKQQDECKRNSIPMVQVKYGESFLICTKQTQEEFGLTKIQEW